VFVSDEPAAEVPAAPAGAFFLVMTHNHALDEQITKRSCGAVTISTSD